jgi:branched-chain amino acid aminotransferase
MSTTFLPYAYFEGRIVPFGDLKLGVATQAVQYGGGVFGGIRGYLDQDGSTINIFRLRDHFARFQQSASLIKVSLPGSVDEMCEVAVELTRRNAPTSNVYYRPFAYNGGDELAPSLGGTPGFALYMLPLGDFLGTKGIALMISSWRRVSDNAIPARGKVSGGYINSAIIKDEARTYGFDDAIVLNDRGKVSEASAANLMLVRHGEIVTPPVSADILEGITRRTVIRLARDAGRAVHEREVDRTELYVADEVFLCGTGAQIAPVSSIDRRPVGRGEPGPVALELQRLFLDVVQGRSSSYQDWLTRVPATVGSKA